MEIKLKKVLVVSHHAKGGGKPLDSLWFSANTCLSSGIALEFLHSKKIQDLKKMMWSKRVLFDGIGSLSGRFGLLYYYLAVILNKRIALYWHETEYSIERFQNLSSKNKHILNKIITNKNVLHFHVCEYGINMLQAKFGIGKKNVYKLNNITESAFLLNTPLPIKLNSDLFVACGTVFHRKGVDLFIDIAQAVLKHKPNAIFIWIGKFTSDRYCEGSIMDELTKRDLRGKVIFTGEVARPDIIIAQAKAFLLTSRDDPMPKVLMEALALGKECIAFDVGGVSELLSHYGTLIPFGDIDKFVDAVLNFRGNDPEKQLEMRNWYIQRYTPAAFAKRFKVAVDYWDNLTKH